MEMEKYKYHLSLILPNHFKSKDLLLHNAAIIT